MVPVMQRLSATLAEAGYPISERSALLYCNDCKAVHFELEERGNQIAFTFTGVDKKWQRVYVDIRRRDGTGKVFLGRCPLEPLPLRKTLYIGCAVVHGDAPLEKPTVH